MFWLLHTDDEVEFVVEVTLKVVLKDDDDVAADVVVGCTICVCGCSMTGGASSDGMFRVNVTSSTLSPFCACMVYWPFAMVFVIWNGIENVAADVVCVVRFVTPSGAVIVTVIGFDFKKLEPEM